jgi:hypothetical protein
VASSVHQRLSATDASLDMGGACEADVDASMRLSFYDLSEAEGEHVRFEDVGDPVVLAEDGRLAKSALRAVLLRWKMMFSLTHLLALTF